jgi:hypothetical protein
MNVPPNMTTPRMKLQEGEEIELKLGGMRLKWVILNRYGELVITNKRVGFVKAIMKSGIISGIANKMGATPMVCFDRTENLKASKLEEKKKLELVLTDGAKTERFWVTEEDMDKVVAALGGDN